MRNKYVIIWNRNLRLGEFFLEIIEKKLFIYLFFLIKKKLYEKFKKLE